MKSTLRALLVLLAPLLAAAPAGADWLVTRAGGRVETQGPWQIKGKLVVFKTSNGTLSSLRLADVDLAVSENATAEAKAAEDEKARAATAEAPKPERKKSVRSLTDADFSRKPDPAAAGKAEVPDGGAKAPAEPADDTKSQVVVGSWTKADRAEGDGLELLGTLENHGKTMVTDVVLRVQLFNEADESIGTAEAILAARTIPAGGHSNFRIPFPGVFTFVRANFDVTNQTINVMPAPRPDGDNDSDVKP